MSESKRDRARRLARERKRRQRARERGEVLPAAPLAVSGDEPPPPPMPEADASDPAGWIERCCRVPSGPAAGKSFKLYRWQRAILGALDNRITVLLCAAQSGKTALMFGALAHRLRRGSPSMVVAPDAEKAGLALARRRVETQLAACPELAALAQVGRASSLGESGRATLRTFRNGGSYIVVGAQSPAQLASHDIETIVGDELARWPSNVGSGEAGRGEGDPVLLLDERTEAFRATRLFLLASTPVVDTDPAAKWAAAGDLRRWHVTCGTCSYSWAPKWEHVEAEPEPAIVCPECSTRYRDGEERLDLLDTGEWRPTQDAPDAGVASYHLPRWLSPASTLRTCVDARRRAERTRKLASWLRLTAAEPAEPDPDIDLKDIKTRLVPEGSTWPPAPIVVTAAGVDLQKNRLEGMVVGRCRNGLLVVLDYVRFYGRPLDPADGTWSELRKWAASHRVRRLFCDSGYFPDVVYNQHRRARWIVPTKGEGGERPLVEPARRHLRIAADVGKGIVYERLSAGTMLIPAWAPWVNDHFLRSLLSETEESTPSGKRKWVKVYTRNEALDAAVLATAALHILPDKPAAPPTLSPLAA